MSTNFEELERQARALSQKEKAELARILIEDLDAAVDADAQHLWLEEAQRRS
jgi:Putative addiction module component